MQIIDSFAKIDDSLKNCCVTIGNFDGFHLGHRKIIETAKVTAARLGTRTVVLTFDPHPVAILHPEKKPQVLTPMPLKACLLEEAGVDVLVVIKDSYKMLTLSPEDFTDEFLVRHLSPKAIVEGDDFHFGYGRSGTVETLKNFGTQFGFEVVVVEHEERKIFDENPSKVSSTAIRHLLQKGKVAAAASAMGRDYRLMGTVIFGRGKGAQLGFPTANIDPYEQIIPAEGVYAGFVTVADNLRKLCANKANLPAVFSLGRAKTFVSKHPLLIEAHILHGQVANLYGKHLAMDFVEHIRNQKRFDKSEHLKEQIEKDCRRAKDILNS